MEEIMVKMIVKIVAVLMMVSGAVWALQGLNLLPGTFMRGDPQWIINGAAMMLVGGAAFWFASRK
jgi:hypothetical protein